MWEYIDKKEVTSQSTCLWLRWSLVVILLRFISHISCLENFLFDCFHIPLTMLFGVSFSEIFNCDDKLERLDAIDICCLIQPLAPEFCSFNFSTPCM
jgi:hypothetical protein